MKTNVRVGAAVGLTAVFFTLYYLILDYFETPAWIPLLVSVLVLGLFAAVCMCLPGLFPAGGKKKLEGVRRRYRRLEESFYELFPQRSFFLQLWFLLFLAFLPAWIALFPGTYGYDAPVQIAEFFREPGTQMSLHHPLVHTWLMGGLFSLGDRFFHSYTAGFVIYMAIQGLAVTGSIAYSLSVCRRHRVPLIWIAVGGVWAACNPFLWVLTFTSTKDILFGAFLLCFTVALWELLECGAPGRGHYIRLGVFGILMCLFRNQGIYMVLALLAFCLLFRAGKRWLYLSLVVVLLVPQALSTVSTKVFDVSPGDKREMLCVPIQQMARLCSLRMAGGGDNLVLTEEQYDTVTELIAPEGIQAFLPDTVDNVKYVFRTDVLAEDFGRYFSNYVAMGVQNPREYLLAWVELIRPYWDMTSNEYKGLAFYYSFPERNRFGIQREERSGFFGKVFSFLYNVIQSTECNLFWRPETCLWILAALPGLAVARKRKTLFLSILPLGLYFGTALLGPVALLRYLFPLTMATPLLLGMLFQRRQAAEDRQEKDFGRKLSK